MQIPVASQPASRPGRILPLALLLAGITPFPAWAVKTPKGAGAGAGAVTVVDSDPDSDDPGTPASEASDDGLQERLLALLEQCLVEGSMRPGALREEYQYVQTCARVATRAGHRRFDEACRAALNEDPDAKAASRAYVQALEREAKAYLPYRIGGSGVPTTTRAVAELEKRLPLAAVRHGEGVLRERLSLEDPTRPLGAGSPFAIPVPAGAGAGLAAEPAPASAERIAARTKVQVRRSRPSAGAGAPAAKPAAGAGPAATQAREGAPQAGAGAPAATRTEETKASASEPDRERILDRVDRALGRAASEDPSVDAQGRYVAAFVESAQEAGFSNLEEASAGDVEALPRVARARAEYFEVLAAQALVLLERPEGLDLGGTLDARTLAAIRAEVPIQAPRDLEGLREGVRIAVGLETFEGFTVSPPAGAARNRVQVRGRRTRQPAGAGAGTAPAAAPAAAPLDDPMVIDFENGRPV
jgi:hypothetical protein